MAHEPEEQPIPTESLTHEWLPHHHPRREKTTVPAADGFEEKMGLSIKVKL